jgi:hypothetical protein
MKSKIKKVVSKKPHTNNYGTTIYHNLEMENGDKINIGKKKEQQIGWELNYEIVETGQQEYNKAQTIKEDNFTSNNPGGGTKTYQKSDVQDDILYQVCLKEATNIISFDGWNNNESAGDKCKYLTDLAYQIASLSKENITKLKAK